MHKTITNPTKQHIAPKTNTHTNNYTKHTNSTVYLYRQQIAHLSQEYTKGLPGISKVCQLKHQPRQEARHRVLLIHQGIYHPFFFVFVINCDFFFHFFFFTVGFPKTNQPKQSTFCIFNSSNTNRGIKTTTHTHKINP